MNKNITHNLYTLMIALIGLFLAACGCSKDKGSEQNTHPKPQKPTQTFSNRPATFDNDDAFLDYIQKTHFNYMWEGAEPNSGLAPERIHIDGNYSLNDQHIITTGGSGFGIAGLLVAMERGFISRAEGVTRFEKIITFLEKADRYHGMWSHWIDGKTGKTKPFSTKDDGGDIVESAFLIQGLLCARQYFQNGNTKEKEISSRIDKLWKEMEWDWYLNGQEVLYWHWSPNYDWQMNFPLKGYDETFITYILGASSPTHPIPAEAYHKGWARSGAIKSSQVTYGLPLVLKHNGGSGYGGPLFWAHYSFIGLNPKGLTDQYADYWTLNKNHTLINYKYCIENPKGYKGYGANCWGLTASYSPKGYAGHSPTNDLGVITPTASLSSFPYTPNESMAALKHFYYDMGDILWGKYGFYDAFSEQYVWYPQRYLAIDQLTITPMIENHRTGFIWKLFMSCPEVQEGLKKLNFHTYSL